MLRPPGDILESFVEPHLSDPSWDEADGGFGSLTQAVKRPEGVIRNTPLATASTIYHGGYVLPPRRNYGAVKGLRFCEAHKAGRM
jgi:hypothetical protein